MRVKRIVANIGVTNLKAAKAFYQDVLGLRIEMNNEWIITYGTVGNAPAQISFASGGGSGAPIPDISIEVDDLDSALHAMQHAAFSIEYGPVAEPWGVRRFFVRDPFGKLINIMQHLLPE